jgi:SET domain-containing protein
MVRVAAFLQWRILTKMTVIEYVGKIEYKRRENNYTMRINGINLWINRDKNGGPAQYINHSCNPNCEFVLGLLANLKQAREVK